MLQTFCKSFNLLGAVIFVKDMISEIFEFLQSPLGGVLMGSILSIVVSVVVTRCEQNQNRRIILYQNEMTLFADVRNSSAKVISYLSTGLIVDVSGLLAEGEYDLARRIVSLRYDELNTALSEYNLRLRTYCGTSNQLLNDLADKTNLAVGDYCCVLNLLSKMCSMINSKEDYDNWQKSISLMQSTCDKENKIFSKFNSKVHDKYYELSPADFCKYLIDDVLVMEENVSLDKYLMMYTGNHMKEYFDSLKNQL